MRYLYNAATAVALLIMWAFNVPLLYVFYHVVTEREPKVFGIICISAMVLLNTIASISSVLEVKQGGVFLRKENQS